MSKMTFWDSIRQGRYGRMEEKRRREGGGGGGGGGANTRSLMAPMAAPK